MYAFVSVNVNVAQRSRSALMRVGVDVVYRLKVIEQKMSHQMKCRLLLLLIVTSDVDAHVELHGAGATAPASVYMAWMAAYRSLRQPFVDVRLSYKARGSGFGKRAMVARSVSYAGSDSLLSESAYEENPDLQMFPVIALSVLPSVNYGRPLSVSGRPCYILPMFFIYLFFMTALFSGPG